MIPEIDAHISTVKWNCDFASHICASKIGGLLKFVILRSSVFDTNTEKVSSFRSCFELCGQVSVVSLCWPIGTSDQFNIKCF